MGRVIMVLTVAAVLAAGAVACGGSSTDASTTAPAPAETQVIPTGTASEVAALFADNCAGCHAAGGGGGSGPDIRGEDSLERVKAQIENGGDGMPAFSGRLTPGQIDALAQYVTGELR
jgi:cytochrome c551